MKTIIDNVNIMIEMLTEEYIELLRNDPLRKLEVEE